MVDLIECQPAPPHPGTEVGRADSGQLAVVQEDAEVAAGSAKEDQARSILSILGDENNCAYIDESRVIDSNMYISPSYTVKIDSRRV